MRLKKLAYKGEPILKTHRYIVVVIEDTGDRFNRTNYYWKNLKEVRKCALRAPPGSRVEVYRTTHNFIQAYEVP